MREAGEIMTGDVSKTICPIFTEASAIQLPANNGYRPFARQAPFQDEDKENWWLGVIDCMPSGVIVLDPKGYVRACNPAACELLGEPLRGEKWFTIIARAFSPQADDNQEISLQDGRKLSVATTSMPDGRGQMIVLTDITNTRITQARLSHQERLVAMGRMVASLAHQLRTPISAAMLYASHFQTSNLTENQQQKFANKILSRLKSIEDQIQNMLVFAKGDSLITAKTSVNDVVHACQDAAEVRLAESNSTLIINNKAGNITFDANQESLVGAIQNLIGNAIDAIGKPAFLSLEIKHQQEFLSFVLADNGPGISDEDMKRVLDPFYTTKTHGTGLGLAVVRSVAHAHAGNMIVESELGKGSRIGFTIKVLNSAASKAI